ncbi:septal ring lytic transglycosylase RlpA family protein [Pelagerythrobacter marensis]|uniref:Endolytic peptidoglycan transglycosylase RlpA n=1 Tax=Pelagerythrobacter marensis TaxID=543877 RepID=A0ABZ2D716_9SPHN
MDGTRPYRRTPLRKLAGLAATLMLTAPAGGPALAETGAQAGAFDASFAHLPAPRPLAAPSVGAVDIAAIEPPVEVEPAGQALGRGVASYYGRRFAGRPTASGEIFDPGRLTAAHRTLPFGSRVKVTNPRNGKSVVVRINDRGPFHKGRTIDLSRAAADELGLIRRGHGSVELVLLD